MKDIDRQMIYRTALGQGPREVLAVHCTLAHSGAWKGLARLMGAEATFHAFDMLSHGRSADWSPDMGDIQDVTVATAREMLDRRMDILGHSFGATVALRVAAERPDLVRSLTLIEPVFFAVAAADAPELLADHDDKAQPFSDAYRAGDTALAARLFNRMWSAGGPKWPDLPETTRAAMTRAIHVVPACHDALYNDSAGLLRPGVLDRINAPVCLLAGSDTHPVMHAINDGLARRLPKATAHIVQGTGHMLPISHPEQTAQFLQAQFAATPE
jgi:pimeloyl-ACP methyl ester carboxylesterase